MEEFECIVDGLTDVALAMQDAVVNDARRRHPSYIPPPTPDINIFIYVDNPSAHNIYFELEDPDYDNDFTARCCHECGTFSTVHHPSCSDRLGVGVGSNRIVRVGVELVNTLRRLQRGTGVSEHIVDRL